ncbi:helix-turn-helix domain-containing protein [Agrobacterium tumefaciens]|uniref:helix-turn-helix domain-containing protein n=1 Tax=Agrobacterium tumefaciens TaxID=358 RepID=UPI000DD50113|nr:AraC family transcriptional regulator [Agrobacterium tumefaciens]WCK68769.1 AraC family transcriptional regulator [Agrobacterium tumefaciens]
MHLENAFDGYASSNLASLGADDAERRLSEAGNLGSAALADIASKSTMGGLAPWQIKRVTDHIEANISEKLCLDRLAALARLSTSYFTAAFRRNFGISPYAYITRRRVEFAKQQMAEGSLPLCEIALECGFADQAHLSRVFRRVTGMTPTAFRQRLKRRDLNRATPNPVLI